MNSGSFAAEIGKIYEIFILNYQNGEVSINNITGATLLKDLTGNSVSICWVKATSATISFSVNHIFGVIGTVLECSSDNLIGILSLSTITYIGANQTAPIKIPISPSGYSLFLATGYQGAQNISWLPEFPFGCEIISASTTVVTAYERGFCQWVLKTKEPYNIFGQNLNSFYFYAY